MTDKSKGAAYAEIYEAYRRSLPRKTERDIQAMKNIARLMDLEGINILQLRKLAYAHIHTK